MPEDLSTPDKSLKKLEREKNRVCEESYIGGLYEIKWQLNYKRRSEEK